MTVVYVYPRLSEPAARQLMAEYAELSPASLRERASFRHPEAAPVAVGGPPVPEEVVAHLAAGIRELADSLGFPEPLNRAHIGDFDRPATALVHDRMAILPSDAASEEVWNFLSLVVLPDVSVWRWPARAEERLLGRPRNVLRRLWWRAEVVGVDLINCADGLGEDELVNIMERPTLAADRRLAQLIGDAIVKSPRVNVARSEVMRDLAKRMLRTQGAFCLDVLTEQDLTVVVQRAMRQSLVALGLPLDKSKPVVELPPPAPTHVPQHADAPPQFTVDRGVPTWAVVYVPGEAHGKASPANCRFRPDSPLATRYVTRYFESLIRTEAPVHLETLYQSFRRDWDVDPYVGNMPEALDRALRRSSIGGQRVSVGADGFVRVPGQSVDVVRVPYDEDPRPPHRVPPEEIRLAVQHLHDELPDATAELLAARLSALFGWPSEAEARRRMGETVGT